EGRVARVQHAVGGLPRPERHRGHRESEPALDRKEFAGWIVAGASLERDVSESHRGLAVTAILVCDRSGGAFAGDRDAFQPIASAESGTSGRPLSGAGVAGTDFVFAGAACVFAGTDFALAGAADPGTAKAKMHASTAPARRPRPRPLRATRLSNSRPEAGRRGAPDPCAARSDSLPCRPWARRRPRAGARGRSRGGG